MSHIFPFRERMGSDMVRENNPCETKKKVMKWKTRLKQEVRGIKGDVVQLVFV